jgi:hypothetical protein
LTNQGNYHPHTSGKGPVPFDAHKYFHAEYSIKQGYAKGEQIKSVVENNSPQGLRDVVTQQSYPIRQNQTGYEQREKVESEMRLS